MGHDYSQVFDTNLPEWGEIQNIFKANEHYPKKKTKHRILHHKFPRAFSRLLGVAIDNDEDNLISLPIDKHFMVHFYYYRIAKSQFKPRMALAFSYMMNISFDELSNISKETAEILSKDYAKNQEDICKLIGNIHKGSKRSPEALCNMRKAQQKRFKDHISKPLSAEHKSLISNALKGKPKSEEMKKKLSQSRKGIIFSLEHRKHISESKQNTVLTDEQRYRLGSAWRGKHPVLSEEHRKHISESKKGKKLTEETKEKISQAHKGKKRGPMSEEHRAKISAARLGEKRGPMSEEQKAIRSAKLKGRHWKLVNGVRVWD